MRRLMMVVALATTIGCGVECDLICGVPRSSCQLGESCAELVCSFEFVGGMCSCDPAVDEMIERCLEDGSTIAM